MKRYNFNTKLNEEEYKILKKLKDEFAVNISRAFKLFLKEYYEKMKNFNNKK
jgi:hypothetical protein